MAAPFDILNGIIEKIKNVHIGKLYPFAELSLITAPQIPLLEKGGILEKGQIGFLEGNGAEAVVPLDRNRKWIHAVANDLKQEMGGNKIEVNITINGANYSDERSLAEAVSHALQNALDRRNAAYA